MRPKLELLEPELVDRVLGEAFELLWNPGVKVQSPAARELLAEAGATVEGEIAHLPEVVARQQLSSVPSEFWLHDRAGNPVVHYGGDDVHFDPGSSGVQVLDPETLEHRPALAPDLVRLIKTAEMLAQYAAQSTAVVCNDVPKSIGDLYRLFLVLWYSDKPIVTGSFSVQTTQLMIDLLAVDCGGRAALKAKPRAVFDVCPSPPLNWSAFASQNLIDLARAAVPAEIVSMPLAGATAPVTLIGAITQHAAECISGMTIHQLAGRGSPIVWGGAPAIFDMRSGATPMGAIETAMIDAAYAQVGKSLNLPTHCYLSASDGKLVDAQAGLESGMTALVGALAGVNMISGAGMLDFLVCQSAEKLVIDAEGIAMAQRLLRGVGTPTDTLATAMFAQTGLKGEFLKLKDTRRLFSQEQYLPSKVIDRGSLRAWQAGGSLDAFGRAKQRVQELLDAYQRPKLASELERELLALIRREVQAAGLQGLPGV
ncbi:trimethylamine---corrinoid protein Co-methyltransferase [Thermoflexales bacterium]|nr:trimethylamine---corrinoid protein Co-methyltransferase [Thermoflexales bacterium]